MAIYRFEILSPLPIDSAIERLANAVRPMPGIWGRTLEFIQNAPETTPFIGTIAGNGFQARPDSRTRNSFLPIIRGAISPLQSGTVVRVTMHLHFGVFAFLAIFYAYALFATVSPEAAGAASRFQGPIFLAALTLIVAAGLRVGFYPEVRSARRTLEEVLETRAD